MPFTWRTDYQNMQPQEIDPRFQNEKKPGKKAAVLVVIFAVVFVVFLVTIAFILRNAL